MKPIYYCLFFLVVLISAKSGIAQKQTFKPFKVDLGALFGASLDEEAGTGGGFYIEPRYSPNDQFTFGLRLEFSHLGAGEIKVGIPPGTVNVDASTINPILLTGDYFFNNQKVRPFVGLGLGLYKRNDLDVDLNSTSIIVDSGSKNNFGFAPRIGLNAGHMRLAAIYNYTGNDISDYIGIQLGFEIGGGRIK